MIVLDLTGQTFGSLTVIDQAGSAGGVKWWRCRCACGGETEVRSNHLRRGEVKACKECRNKAVSAANTTHGLTKTPEYKTWLNIRDRCYNPENISYKYYGGRGIRVCKRWRASFEDFLADMGKRPSAKHSIERKNTNGNYTPDNCCWATAKEQANNRRNNR